MISKNYVTISVVILLLLFIVAGFLINQQRNNSQEKKEPTTNLSNQLKKYTVKVNDNLWNIAEQHYGSGYNATDIAAANKLTKPDTIHAGQEIILPSITPKTPTAGEILTQNTKRLEKDMQHTIKSGDSLWNIAQQYYGDGYAWTKIAQANNLTNPDLIHSDNKLLIPKT